MCCSFLLHVVANLICMFLASCQLFLLSSLPKYIFILWSKRKYTAVLLKKFYLDRCQSYLSFFEGSKLRIHLNEWGQSVHYIIYFCSCKFLDQSRFKVLFRIPQFWANIASFFWIHFSFLQEISQPRYLKFFTFWGRGGRGLLLRRDAVGHPKASVAVCLPWKLQVLRTGSKFTHFTACKNSTLWAR